MPDPKPFQIAAIDAAYDSFTKNSGSKRFLVADEVGLGKTVVAQQVIERLAGTDRRSERRDREQVQQRDLYSIDAVIPKERFQAPVRIRAFAHASSPSLAEIDLTSWRPDHEIAEACTAPGSLDIN